jgi:carbonic anhydrase
MFRHPAANIPTLALCLLCCLLFLYPVPVGSGQAAQPPEKPQPHQHEHQHQMMMNLPSGVSDKCEPKFTYEPGPHGPDAWGGVCKSGRMQSPIDITRSEKIDSPPLPPLQFRYEAADLDMVNECNKYVIKARFPANQWLKYNRKPYRLSEVTFHEPAETAVKGKRAPMSVQLIHLSPEATLLIIEVPVAVGKENPTIKTLWEHIPAGGKEQTAANVKINAMDLLPADHGYYRFPGSMTTPLCNEGVTWFLMKNPIEMSQTQIDQYKKYYHDTARPLQPLNDRPIFETK